MVVLISRLLSGRCGGPVWPQGIPGVVCHMVSAPAGEEEVSEAGQGQADLARQLPPAMAWSQWG